MTIVEESKGQAPKIPDGLYTFQIVDVIDGIRQSDTFGKAGEPTITLRCLIMGVLNEEGEDVYLDPLLSRTFSRSKTNPSNLYLYAKGAGVLPPEGHPFDTDLLKDKVLQGMIITEEGKWPKFVLESLKPAGKGNTTSAPWEGEKVDGDTISAWWKDMLGQGFDRTAIVALSKEMFEQRTPGDLNAEELKGLTDQLNRSA